MVWLGDSKAIGANSVPIKLGTYLTPKIAQVLLSVTEPQDFGPFKTRKSGLRL